MQIVRRQSNFWQRSGLLHNQIEVYEFHALLKCSDKTCITFKTVFLRENLPATNSEASQG
jgi:hypothetical protein